MKYKKQKQTNQWLGNYKVVICYKTKRHYNEILQRNFGGSVVRASASHHWD